jgi:hypothetical protein
MLLRAPVTVLAVPALVMLMTESPTFRFDA